MKIIESIASKADAHRALICGELSGGMCHILYGSTSRDIQATENCLRALREGQQDMYCGESGSTLRFLLPIMGALGQQAVFHREGSLPRRPLTPLYEELEAHGCKLSPQNQNPLTIRGLLRPGVYKIPGNVSSQYISGLLFALPLLSGDSEIIVEGTLESAAYVDMTMKTLSDFGIAIHRTGQGFAVPGGQTYIAPPIYTVEGDWSNACFFLAAGALYGDGIKVTGLNPASLQGDKVIVSILREMGANVFVTPDTITVTPGKLKATTIDVSQIPDMTPVLSVLALAAEGITEITGGARLRLKESDRLAVLTETLTALGGQIKELPDGLLIRGGCRLQGGVIHTHHDHRIAMMAAVASLISDGTVTIRQAAAVEKSYPTFFEEWEKAGLGWNIERE